ncbi:MAG: competence protein [Rikenellaceae bacterium]
MKRIFIIYLYIIGVVTPLAAQVDSLSESHAEQAVSMEEVSPEELWKRGTNAYVNNEFAKAVEYFSQIESRGLYSLPLYYNLGNGYFKMGDIAHSLLYLYKAQRLDPSDSDTKYNIEVVQAQTKDKIEAIPQFILAEWNEVIGSSLSIMGWSIISLVAWCGVLAFLILFILSKQLERRKMGFYGMVLCGVVMFLSTSYAIGERDEVVNDREAVVMSQSLSAKSSPTTTATELFILHAGTKVGVISSLEGWSQIVIADGRQGWVESKLLEVI